MSEEQNTGTEENTEPVEGNAGNEEITEGVNDQKTESNEAEAEQVNEEVEEKTPDPEPTPEPTKPKSTPKSKATVLCSYRSAGKIYALSAKKDAKTGKLTFDSKEVKEPVPSEVPQRLQIRASELETALNQIVYGVH